MVVDPCLYFERVVAAQYPQLYIRRATYILRSLPITPCRPRNNLSVSFMLPPDHPVSNRDST